MKHLEKLSALFVLLLIFPSSILARSGADPVRTAVTGDPEAASSAIARLRDMGPKGLDLLLDANARAIERARSGEPMHSDDWERIRRAIDRVGMQYDGYTSGLYWYTDFKAAVESARRTGRPILSLHMLGRLDEEFSCANSRFFRATLYLNPRVASFLRKNFVLHWRSVRPVPKVTIDYGDGRRIETTITGNSIHYVLDRYGRPVDALPGLYDATRFVSELETSCQAAREAETLNAQERADYLREYHGAAQLRSQQEMTDISLEIAASATASERNEALTNPVGLEPLRLDEPRARDAMARVETKSVIELPILRAFDLERAVATADFSDPAWRRIVMARNLRVPLCAESRAYIQRQLTPDYISRFAGMSENDVLRAVQYQLETSIAVDTLANELVLRQSIRQQIMNSGGEVDLEFINEWVYGLVFLTPSSDPWLGLHPGFRFTGISGAGVRP